MKLSSPLLIVTAVLLATTIRPCLGAGNEFSKFTASYCLDCHDTETKKGGLDISALKLDPDEAVNA